MAEDTGPAPPTGPPPEERPARRFKDAGDAAKEVDERFGAWTSALGKYGLQFALALMAANWALHGTHSAILDNPWSKWSMAVALGYLALTLLLLWLMVFVSGKRHRYADENKARWAREFDEYAEGAHAWPYTRGMERIGYSMHRLHFWGPMLSGILLLVSVFATPGPNRGVAQPDQRNSDAACCAAATDDIAKIRRLLENASRPPSDLRPASGADGVMVVRGETNLGGSSWLVGGIAFALVVGGGVLLVISKNAAAKAAGASLLTIGALTGGGLTLFKDVKVDSIFKIDMDKLFEVVRGEVRTYGDAGPERLTVIDKFKLGDDTQIATDQGAAISVSDSPKIEAATKAWLDGRKHGRTAVLLVIGATDRLSISGSKGQQFDANFGLARARAEAVKRALIAKCKSVERTCDLNEDQIITLVSGPRQTPASENSSPSSRRDGFPEDRRVDIWALWTRPKLRGEAK